MLTFAVLFGSGAHAISVDIKRVEKQLQPNAKNKNIYFKKKCESFQLLVRFLASLPFYSPPVVVRPGFFGDLDRPNRSLE